MSHKPGTVLTGVHTLWALQLRCYVNPDTGCWHWRGAFRKTTGGKMVPVTFLPALKSTVTVMRAAVLLSRGMQSMSSKQCVWADCMRSDCCNPGHMRVGTRGQMAAHQIKNGAGRTRASYIAGSIKSARARSKVTLEQIEGFRRSGISAKDLAEQAGISVSHAYRILRVKHWKPKPVLAGASVFSLGAAL